MTQVYFHCSSSREVRMDRSGEAVSDLTEARDRGGLHRPLAHHGTRRGRLARLGCARQRRFQRRDLGSPLRIRPRQAALSA